MSRNRLSGKAVIRVDGREYLSQHGAKFTPGGETRTTQKGGGRIHGFSAEDQEPMVECTFSHNDSVSLKALGDIEDATILFSCDSGVQYIISNAWLVDPAELDTSNAGASVKFAGISWDELGVNNG